MEEDNPTISIVLDERATRALSQAVNFTMDKWAGQEPIDQEELFNLKPFLHGACLEFNLMRS